MALSPRDRAGIVLNGASSLSPTLHSSRRSVNSPTSSTPSAADTQNRIAIPMGAGKDSSRMSGRRGWTRVRVASTCLPTTTRPGGQHAAARECDSIRVGRLPASRNKGVERRHLPERDCRPQSSTNTREVPLHRWRSCLERLYPNSTWRRSCPDRTADDVVAATALEGGDVVLRLDCQGDVFDA